MFMSHVKLVSKVPQQLVSAVYFNIIRFLSWSPVITPEVKVARKRQEIIHKLQNVITPGISNPRAIYDGKALLYSSQPLNLPGGGAGSVNI